MRMAEKITSPVTNGLKSDANKAGSAVKHPIKASRMTKSAIKRVTIAFDGLNGLFRE